MKIFTSYYENFKNIPTNYICVGISRIIPEEFKTTDIKNFLYTPNNILAPSMKLLCDIKNGSIDNDEYAKRYYIEIQDRIKKNGYYSLNEYFAKMVSGFDKNNDEGFDALVFLCYEKPNEFCHRHLLAALMNKLGYDVKEYDARPKNHITKYTDELF